MSEWDEQMRHLAFLFIGVKGSHNNWHALWTLHKVQVVQAYNKYNLTAFTKWADFTISYNDSTIRIYILGFIISRISSGAIYLQRSLLARRVFFNTWSPLLPLHFVLSRLLTCWHFHGSIHHEKFHLYNTFYLLVLFHTRYQCHSRLTSECHSGLTSNHTECHSGLTSDHDECHSGLTSNLDKQHIKKLFPSVMPPCMIQRVPLS